MFKHTEKAGSEPKTRTNSVVVAVALDDTQAEDKITSLKFIAKGDRLHGVSAIPVNSILQKIGKNIVTNFRLARVAERFVKERKKKSPTLELYNNVDEAVEVRMLCLTSNSDVVQTLVEAYMDLVCKKAWDLHKNISKVRGTCVQACKKFFRPPNRTTQEKFVKSRSDYEHENPEFIVDSGASLHMMSKSALTSGEKDTIGRSKEPTVTKSANGKAESTEEVTVYVNDLDVSVTMNLLED